MRSLVVLLLAVLLLTVLLLVGLAINLTSHRNQRYCLKDDALPRSLALTRLPHFIASRMLIMMADVKPMTMYPKKPLKTILRSYREVIPRMRPGMSVYVATHNLPKFLERVYPAMKRAQLHSMVLLTVYSDLSAPQEALGTKWKARLQQLQEDGVFRAWFAQNVDIDVSANNGWLRPLPLGIDYHSQAERGLWGARLSPEEQEAALLRIRNAAPLLSSRRLAVFTDTHLSSYTNPRDRSAMHTALTANLPPHALHILPKRLPRQEFWAACAQCAFVASPLGNGMDCHRTWEALALGCIPIVKRTTLSPLFEDLPVLQVEDYKDITLEALTEFYEHIKNSPKYGQAAVDERLSLRTWARHIHSV